jgi:hypothetical protein
LTGFAVAGRLRRILPLPFSKVTGGKKYTPGADRGHFEKSDPWPIRVLERGKCTLTLVHIFIKWDALNSQPSNGNIELNTGEVNTRQVAE